MDRSLSEDALSANHPCNRSCKLKIQDDSMHSQNTPTIKFKATRSQNELKPVDGQVQMDALYERWYRNEQKTKNKAEGGDNAAENHEEDYLKNVKKVKTLKLGADLVNSEEIFLDDELEAMSQHLQNSKNLKKPSNEEAKLADQRRKREMQKTMALNILILGKSGLGKSSFIDCFSNKNYESSPIIRCRTELLSIIPVRSETGNFEIKFIDMPGYDETNTNQYINDVELLISKRLENHLNKLSDKNALRNQIVDERIHCVLFFLSGPWISEFDWLIMKKIENITNIIPIIAKGDTYSTREIRQFKKKVFEKNKIMNVNWFSIEEILRQYNPQKLKNLLEGTFGRSPPFVIICCTEKQYNEETRKRELIREFRWGKCELNNENHNDFKFLKSLLMYYLSDLLIKYTEISMRSFQQKLVEIRYRELREHKKIGNQLKNEKEKLPPIEISMSQTQDLSIKQENELFELLRKFVPIGLTTMAILGTYFMARRNK